MIALSWALLFIAVALVCFGVAAVGRGAWWRIALVPAGLFFLTLYLIASGDLIHVHIGG